MAASPQPAALVMGRVPTGIVAVGIPQCLIQISSLPPSAALSFGDLVTHLGLAEWGAGMAQWPSSSSWCPAQPFTSSRDFPWDVQTSGRPKAALCFFPNSWQATSVSLVHPLHQHRLIPGTSSGKLRQGLLLGSGEPWCHAHIPNTLAQMSNKLL